MYVTSNSRPDIAFAVHQCAIFIHNIKHYHEKAILRICKYLKVNSKDGKYEGFIIYPSKKMQVDWYFGAHIYGIYGQEDHQDSVFVWSRTRYVLNFSDYPIMWVSNFQTELAVSTLYSKYAALSQSMRYLLPLKTLYMDVIKGLVLDP